MSLSKASAVTLIPITNMNRALKFYTKSVGAKLVERGTGEMRNFWAAIRIGGSDFWLVAPTKREARKLAYTTFVVQNIRTVVRQLQEKGVRFQRAVKMTPDTKLEGPIAWEPYGANAFFKDSEGNLLMVWHNNPGT